MKTHPPGTVIGEPMLGSDPDDGDVLTYEITGGNDLGIFTIGEDTAVVQIAANVVVDFERRSSYRLVITATDKCVSDCSAGRAFRNMASSSVMMVIIKDVNEPPSLVGTSCVIDENVPSGTKCKHTTEKKLKELVTDPDANEVFAYSFRIGKGTYSQTTKDGVFNIEINTGIISSAGPPLDYETKPLYRLTAVVFDKAGLISNEVKFDVYVLNVNDAPVLPMRHLVTLPENSFSGYRVGAPILGKDQDSNDRLTYSITGDNCWSEDTIGGKGSFVIPLSAGVSKVGETPKSLSFEVIATEAAKIQLRTSASDSRASYEISFGENGNTASFIKRCDTDGNCNNLVEYPTPPKSR